MADETQPDTATLADTERKIDPPSVFDPGRDIDQPTKSGLVRLRAFEDAMFGADCVRIGGRIERGYGSKFKAMTAPRAAHYAALEKLVAAEQQLEAARAAQADAETAAWAAHELADKTEAKIDGPASE